MVSSSSLCWLPVDISKHFVRLLQPLTSNLILSIPFDFLPARTSPSPSLTLWSPPSLPLLLTPYPLPLSLHYSLPVPSLSPSLPLLLTPYPLLLSLTSPCLTHSLSLPSLPPLPTVCPLPLSLHYLPPASPSPSLLHWLPLFPFTDTLYIFPINQKIRTINF